MADTVRLNHTSPLDLPDFTAGETVTHTDLGEVTVVSTTTEEVPTRLDANGPIETANVVTEVTVEAATGATRTVPADEVTKHNR